MTKSTKITILIIALAIILVASFVILEINKNFQNKNISTELANVANEAGKEGEQLIPKGSLLREYEKIPGLDPESYLGIYISNYTINEVGAKIDDQEGGYYMSCSGEVMGQSACGEYHLFLVQNNKIINDVMIPTYPWLDAKEDLCLSFNNTKENNARFFEGEAPTENDKFDIERTNLIHFDDYTGDKLKYEFLIVGQTNACGHENRLVAGYDKVNNKAIVYEIYVMDTETYYWFDNFKPDSNGNVKVIWHCLDHGAMDEAISEFSFSKKFNAYAFKSYQKRACNEKELNIK